MKPETPNNAMQVQEDATSIPVVAATDLTTGFGVDSFFMAGSAPDPWAESCVQTLVDLAVNHSEFCYPLPGTIDHDKQESSIPKTIAIFATRKLIRAHAGSTAADVIPSDDDLDRELTNFFKWARSKHENTKLRQWVAFHFCEHVKEKHLGALPRDVQPAVSAFWEKRASVVHPICAQVNLTSDQLRYAFDVMYRGRQYYEVLAHQAYFPHPLRHALFKGAELSSVTRRVWSWGSAIVESTNAGWLARDLSQLGDTVTALRTAMSSVQTRWTDLDSLPPKQTHAVLMEVACQAKLPVKLTDNLKGRLDHALEVGAFGAAIVGGVKPPFHSLHVLALALHAGHFLLGRWSGKVSSAALSIPFCRGILTVPGLYNDTEPV